MDLIILLILMVVLGAIAYYFGRSFVRGAPYAPTDKKAIQAMLRLTNAGPGDFACDIGAGDGRIVIKLAEKGARVNGIEINPFLVIAANLWIRKKGIADKARVMKKNLWKINYNKYNVVTVFGIPYIMKSLEKKLLAELPTGARVASNAFAFPNWKSIAKEDGVYLYKKE